MNAPNTFLFALMSLMTLVSSLRSVSVGRFQSLCYVQEEEKDFNDCIEFLSYFEKNSSLVGLNFGLCIYVSMYVCMFLSMYWVMSHQSDWGYYTALESDPPMKWLVQTVLWFLKVNQGDIGFGHLENIASWKHLDNFSTLSGRNQFFTLCTFFFQLLIFSSECKATCAGLLGRQLVMMRFGH